MFLLNPNEKKKNYKRRMISVFREFRNFTSDDPYSCNFYMKEKCDSRTFFLSQGHNLFLDQNDVAENVCFIPLLLSM